MTVKIIIDKINFPINFLRFEAENSLNAFTFQ